MVHRVNFIKIDRFFAHLVPSILATPNFYPPNFSASKPRKVRWEIGKSLNKAPVRAGPCHGPIGRGGQSPGIVESVLYSAFGYL